MPMSRKNPYVQELIELSKAPSSRFSELERHLQALILVGKIFNLRMVDGYYYRGDHTRLFPFYTSDRKLAFVGLSFNSKPFYPKWINLIRTERELKRYREETLPLVLLQVSNDNVQTLFNGTVPVKMLLKRWGSETWFESLINTEFIGPKVSIRPMTIAQANEQYYGSDTPPKLDRNGSSGSIGSDGDGDGGGSGNGGGDSGNGGDGEQSGGQGITEILNHPVLFSVDKETLQSILRIV